MGSDPNDCHRRHNTSAEKEQCIHRGQAFQSLMFIGPFFPRPNSLSLPHSNFPLTSNSPPTPLSPSPTLPKLHYFSNISSFMFVLKANRGEKRAQPYPRGEVMSKTQGRVAAQLMGLSSPSWGDARWRWVRPEWEQAELCLLSWRGFKRVIG